jgi:predicted anti-sigma-YlaC factor YlaD
MDCLQVREAISARLDGESAGVAETLVTAHVQRCSGCQAWREAAHDVTRRARMTGWTPPGELPDFAALVGAVAVRRTAWLPRVLTGLLAAAALGQLVLAVMLLGGAADQMGMHGDHELGIFDITLAVAFGVGALRPKLAAGLAWAAGAAAAGLLATATADVIDHHTIELHELKHLIAVGGALLLWWTARDARRTGPEGVRHESEPSIANERQGATHLRSTAA